MGLGCRREEEQDQAGRWEEVKNVFYSMDQTAIYFPLYVKQREVDEAGWFKGLVIAYRAFKP